MEPKLCLGAIIITPTSAVRQRYRESGLFFEYRFSFKDFSSKIMSETAPGINAYQQHAEIVIVREANG